MCCLLVLCGAEPASRPALQSRCELLVMEWKPRFDREKFSVVIAPPFVLAGDGGGARLEAWRDHTVLAAQRALQHMYFKTEPTTPILVLLFETGDSYRRLAREWFNDDDVPHFGFCRADGIMLMNISTGGGTLVHELAHALLRPDFPNCPTWLNEGLASLYEQCQIGRDQITGLKNWRLPLLQRALKDNSLRPLSELASDPGFYDDRLSGLNYAQARYVMMYLQEKGLLQKFYALSREQVGSDPTCLKSLEAVIAPQSLEQFEAAWREWVLSL